MLEYQTSPRHHKAFTCAVYAVREDDTGGAAAMNLDMSKFVHGCVISMSCSRR